MNDLQRASIVTLSTVTFCAGFVLVMNGWFPVGIGVLTVAALVRTLADRGDRSAAAGELEVGTPPPTLRTRSTLRRARWIGRVAAVAAVVVLIYGMWHPDHGLWLIAAAAGLFLVSNFLGELTRRPRPPGTRRLVFRS